MSEKKILALDVEEPAERESKCIYITVTKLSRLGAVCQNSEVTCKVQSIHLKISVSISPPP